jgi:hypothetical protein
MTFTYLFPEKISGIERSTLLAQVAKTSQGLIPPSFLISIAKVQRFLLENK